MSRLPARLASLAAGSAAALAPALALTLALTPAAPVAAQQSGGTFSLPPSRPSPTPAPAGPADERAGVAIPPRAVSAPRPTPTPTPAPITAPTAAPTIPPRTVIDTAPPPAAPRTAASPAPAPARERAPQTGASAPSPAQPLPEPSPPLSPEAGTDAGAGPAFPSAPAPEAAAPPLALPPSAAPDAASDPLAALPAWWPFAAGGLGAAVVLGFGGWLLMRRRKPKVLRLAAHPAAAAGEPEAAPDLADLHLILDVTSATRSIMMFTLGYRLTISNRSGRAVGNLTSAVELVCARASAGRGPSAGAAQALGGIERIGPHQARSISGEVQLPLSAIQPLRQGTKPVFVPLVHVTLEAEGLPAITRSFVVGPRSPSGRVHPIGLDQGPGGITGLVAQAIAAPPASAAA
jgi:hypothetical protein